MLVRRAQKGLWLRVRYGDGVMHRIRARIGAEKVFIGFPPQAHHKITLCECGLNSGAAQCTTRVGSNDRHMGKHPSVG